MEIKELIPIVIALIVLVCLNIVRVRMKDQATRTKKQYEEMTKLAFKNGYEDGFAYVNEKRTKGVV